MFTFAFIKSRIHYIIGLLPKLSVVKIYTAIVAYVSFIFKRDRSCKCPPLVTISLTLQCNYSCIMCQKSSVHDNPYKHPESFDYDILASFLKENARYLSLVRLHGGEPLFYKEIPRLLDLLVELKIPYSIISNGYLLKPEISKKLVNNCLGLSLSIDAVDPEIYGFIRRGGDIETITSNIVHLNKLKKETGSVIPILNLTMAAFSFNIPELPRLVRFCHENGIPSLSATEGWFYDTPYVREEHLIKNHTEPARKYIAEAQQLTSELGIILRLRFPSLNSQKDVSLKSVGKKEKLKNCLNLYISSFIHPNLDVIVCCDAKETFGNLKNNSFREIWNGPKYIEARKKLRNNEVPASCEGCANLYV